MKRQAIYILLVFLLKSFLAHSQTIHYFTSDSNAYLVPDIYAAIDDQIYSILDASELDCWTMIEQRDFNNDGRSDLLLGHVNGCGGNCCANTYCFVLFHQGQFIRTKEVGNGDYLETQQWKGQTSILLQTNLQDSLTGHRKWIKERYALQGNQIVKISEYRSAKINTSESNYKLNWDNSKYQTATYFEHKIYKEGQSLWALANKHQTTVAVLKQLNQLTSDKIFIGDVIKIPNAKANRFHVHHIQKTGETLWAISQQYQVPIAVLKQINSITTNTIKVGETLKIPKLD